MGQPIRDENGKILGYFITEAEHQRYMYDLSKADSYRQEAENAAKGIIRKWDGTNGMTTAQVLALFKKLDKQAEGGQ